ERHAPADPRHGEEDQVDPPGVRQMVVQGHRAPHPEGQEADDAEGGDEAAGARRHQRLLRNRKKATRPMTTAAKAQGSHSQSARVATAKTRIARKAPQAALTRATRIVPPRPRRPVSRSAIQARPRAPARAMAISIYCTGRRSLECCATLWR